MTSTDTSVEDLCIRSMQIMVDGSLDDFEAVVHPGAHNRESIDEPPACRGRGPAAFHATALWLRAAFGELAFEVHDVVAQDDLVVVHDTMTGRHTGPMVGYGPDGRPSLVMPPTGRRFATRQTHWFRVADGFVVEHWANRDDLGTALQLGWLPPSPLFMARSLLATVRARREAGR